MKIIECVQGTTEWFNARIGIPTASCFDKIITTQGEPSKQRQKYLYQLVGEKITGIPEASYQNSAMTRGTEMEDEARNFYSLTNDDPVVVGFCLQDNLQYGASPDGLVGENGGLEIKCPNLATHVEYLLSNKLPTAYFQQVQGNLLVTGREWWDFISYYPGIKPLIVRTYPDKVFLNALKIELEIFFTELEITIDKLK